MRSVPLSAILLHPRNLLLLLAVMSTSALAAALVAQYAFGMRPCHLCILQRWPHLAVAVVGILGFLALKTRRQQRLALGLCILLFLIGTGIAGYHAGVETGVFKGPSDCTMDGTVPDSIEAMRAQIMGAAIVPCDQPLGYVFGLSLAVWSLLIYSFLTILAAYGYKRSHLQDPS